MDGFEKNGNDESTYPFRWILDLYFDERAYCIDISLFLPNKMVSTKMASMSVVVNESVVSRRKRVKLQKNKRKRLLLPSTRKRNLQRSK